MNKKILLISFILLTTNISYAEETITSIEKINQRIVKMKKFLKDVPKSISDKEEQLNELTEKLNKNREMINRYLNILDSCVMNFSSVQLDDVCKLMIESKNGELLKERENQLSDTIEFLNHGLEQEKRKLKNINVIKEAIHALEDTKNILLGER